MKERVLFIAVGQGGGNIGQLFEKKGYNCLFINTAFDDLKTIDAKHKFHIAGTFGCNKDRKKALKYVKESYKTINNVIDNRFPQQDLIYFIFTTGGGTGSGLSPVLLDIISQKNPQKHYGAITVLPSLSESLKSQINGVDAYKDLARISKLKSLIVLDNNNIKDKFELNKQFVEIFDTFMNISIPDERGIIDTSELETLITCKGSMYLAMTKKSEHNENIKPTNLAEDIININDKSPFTPFDTGTCRYLAVSQSGKVDMSDMKNLIGTPIDTFFGYNDEFNFTIMAGMPYPKQRIKELIENINKEQIKIEIEQQENNENDFFKDIEIPVLRVNEYNPNSKIATSEDIIKEYERKNEKSANISTDINKEKQEEVNADDFFKKGKNFKRNFEENEDKIDIEDIFKKFS